MPPNWYEKFNRRLWLRPDDTGEEDAKYLITLLGLHKGSKVLDCPCGAGRIGFHLARAGCRITGVDQCRNFVERANNRFCSAGLAGKFIVADMRTISFSQTFDAAINYWGSFGYFSDDENLEFLHRLAGAVRKGGLVLVEQLRRSFMLRNFRRRIVADPAVVYPKWNRRTQRIEATWRIDGSSGGGNYFSSIRLYTPVQFQRLFAMAGLKLIELAPGPEISGFEPNTARILAVGKK